MAFSVFFQAEDGIRDSPVNGVQTCALPIYQDSGIGHEQIIELHGNGTYGTCLKCKLRHELEEILRRFEENEELPVCRDCGGIVKTATISFGQSMPVDEMRRRSEERRVGKECRSRWSPDH